MASKLYSKEILIEAAKHSDSIADMIRYLDKPITGSRYNYISRLIKEYELDISHFTRTQKHTITEKLKRKPAEEILILLTEKNAKRTSGHLLRRAMQDKGVSYECAVCHTSEWMGKPLTLDVDHIDGNYLDCRLHNLRFLCPNCHRQTPTFGRIKTIPKEKLICACGKPKDSRSKCCVSCHANRRQDK